MKNEGGKASSKGFVERSFNALGRTFKLGGPIPELREGEELVRKTISLCPTCCRLLPAIIFERDEKIWIRKICPEHGEVEEIYWGDAKLFYKALRYEAKTKPIKVKYVDAKAPCPFTCGLCPYHMTYTALANIVLTNRCDLSCWYCLPGDQEILVKENGVVKLVSIEELASGRKYSYRVKVGDIEGEYSIPENLEVLSYNSQGRLVWTRVRKIFRRKYKGKIYTIRTKSGKEVKVTPEHRILVYEGRQLMKKRAENISIGNKLLSMFKIPEVKGSFNSMDLIKELRNIPENYYGKIYVHNINSVKTHEMKKHFGEKVYLWKSKKYVPLKVLYSTNYVQYNQQLCYLGLDAATYRIPVVLKITPELAKLVGYFISDGHYTNKDLRITAKDEEVRKDIITTLKSLGLPYSILLKEGKAPQVVIGSRLLRLIFKYVFKIPEKAPNKRLPKQVFEFPLDAKIALLSSLFNGDGYVIKGKRHLSLGYASTSKGLIRDLSYLLASLGIFSRIRRVSKDKNKLARHDLYKLYIAGKDLVKLVNLIDLKTSHKRKLHGLNARREVRVDKIGDCIVDEVISIQVEEYEGLVYDLEVENPNHNFIVNDGILVSNCFFYAERVGYVYEPSIEQLRDMIRSLKKQHPSGGLAVQLTGGEPALRDDLLDIVKMIKEEGIRHIQLNTHGLRFAYAGGDKLMAELRKVGLNTVYLSFDGVSPAVNFKNHWEIPFILENFRRAGMTSVVLVPTVINNWNTDELGAIVKFAARNMDVIRGINMQPVSLTGQLTESEREKYRITIPDVIKLIEEQTDGQIDRDSWYPVPITVIISRFIQLFTGENKMQITVHPACGMATYVHVHMKNNGEIEFTPITRFVDIEGFFEYLKEKSDELEKGRNKYIVGLKILYNLRKFIDSEKQPKDINLWKLIFNIFVRHSYEALGEFHYKFLYIGMMHFMDLYNYDVQRVLHCGVHYLVPGGKIIPFCAFNVLPDLYRDKIQKEYGIPMKEWIKLKGYHTIGDAIKYKRNIKKLESTELYKKTYAEFKEYLNKR